jgi:hypothetical protein
MTIIGEGRARKNNNVRARSAYTRNALIEISLHLIIFNFQLSIFNPIVNVRSLTRPHKSSEIRANFAACFIRALQY